MDRRSFIRNSAAATLVAAQRAPAANDRIQLGFVGIGGRGGWLSRAFDAIGQKQGLCRVVAVCDIWERRRREAAELYKCQGYADYREVVNRADVDAGPQDWRVLPRQLTRRLLAARSGWPGRSTGRSGSRRSRASG